ncbi:MAG: hypothetical protein V3T99_07080, partial [Nitrososphaerales archaeon]
LRKGIILLLGLSAAGFGITSLGVYALSPSFAMFGTATLVVSALLATALIVSSLVFAMARPTYLRINSMWHIMTDSMRVRKQAPSQRAS